MTDADRVDVRQTESRTKLAQESDRLSAGVLPAPHRCDDSDASFPELAHVNYSFGLSTPDIYTSEQAAVCRSVRERELLSPAVSPARADHLEQGIVRLRRKFRQYSRHPMRRAGGVPVPPGLTLVLCPALGNQIRNQILVERPAFGRPSISNSCSSVIPLKLGDFV